MNIDIVSWFGSILLYAVINSLFAAGCLNAIKQMIAKPTESGEDLRLPKKFVIAFMYTCAAAFAVYFRHQLPLSQTIVNTILIGSISIIAYDAVLKSFLQLIPKIFDKFLG